MSQSAPTPTPEDALQSFSLLDKVGRSEAEAVEDSRFIANLNKAKESLSSGDWRTATLLCRSLRAAAVANKYYSKIEGPLIAFANSVSALYALQINKPRAIMTARMAKAARKIQQIERLASLLRVLS